MKLKLTIAYFGQRYHGWQHQPGLPTVQGCLQDVARRVLREPVEVIGASRTDAGVHAEGQVAHVQVADLHIPPHRVAEALTARLPSDIDVRRADVMDEAFHARLNACWKWYRYRVHNADSRPVGDWGRSWHYWRKVDDGRLRAAAARFVGTRDFAALQARSSQPRESTVRTVHRVDVYRHYDELIFDVVGNGFLYKMVRNIVGVVLEVGRGKRDPDWIDEALAAGDAARDIGGMVTAPAHGLTLMEIHYEPYGALSPVAY
ncbi:MAG: tRNA pseudouridine synthase A [Phycisphaerae bacterium]|nr:tRNA pseudouridine synthase A [Phycisphaerae bacterium]